MEENSIRGILRLLLKELLDKKNRRQATVVEEFVSLIKKQKNLQLSEKLDEILDNLLSLHHYGDGEDYSLNDAEIQEIYNNLD